MKYYLTMLIILGSVFVHCQNEGKNPMRSKKIDLSTINDAAINALAKQKIFFGHKSVGYNILDGLNQVLKDEPRFKNLNIIDWTDNLLPSTPGIYHASNGKNNYPDTKCDAFLQTLKANQIGNEFDIAFFKFCYVDFTAESDVQKIFDYYVSTIQQVQQSFPHLRVIHVTSPLYVHALTIKNKIKRLFVPDMENVKRNEFNALLTQKYGDQEPIFDLARIEATRPDGTFETFTHQGKTYFALYKQYTDDGGHLNELGRQIIAQELLRMLANVSESDTTIESTVTKENH